PALALPNSFRAYRAVPFLGRYFNPLFLSHFHSRKSLLQTGDDLTTSLGVLERLFALVGFDGFAIFAGKRVLEADDGAILHNIVFFALLGRESGGYKHIKCGGSH